MAIIGQRTRHVDWRSITNGSAKYAADIHLKDELTAAVLRSPHPHARIISIDTAQARKIPGVHAVLTAADITNRMYIDYRGTDQDRRVLATDTVRYIGEPVALVAADNLQIAQQALAAIKVRYRAFRTLDTVAKATAPTAPHIHPHPKTKNVAFQIARSFSVSNKNQSPSKHVVKATYLSSRQAHAIMEPHTVKAQWKAEERCLHVWAPSQNPRMIQRDLAQLFTLDLSAVRMHEFFVGGDFGGRTQISSTEALVCALSLATNRPVALYQSRTEEFAYSKWRLSWDTRLELACDADGRVTDLSAEFDIDNGAYNQAGPGEMIYGSVALGSSYRWRNYNAVGKCIYTNKTPASSFRGAGGYAVNWSLECAIDQLADAAKIDPIDFRILNAVSVEDEVSLTGWAIKSSGLRQCLEIVRREIEWDHKRKLGGNGRGVGVACVIHVTALSRDYMLRSSAALDVNATGHVTIRSGCADAGTGQKTLVCQTVADVLQLSMDEISIVTTDTINTPHDAGAGASRGTFVSVSTARALAEKVRDQFKAAAATKLGVDLAQVEWSDGKAKYGNHVLNLADLAALIDGGDGVYSTDIEFVGASHDADPKGFEDIAPTYSFAAHAVEVEVDQDTGLVKVLNVVAAHDSGTIINPISARGQVEGGVVMGLGAILGESLIFEEGRLINGSYADYAIPRAFNTPNIKTVFVETTDPIGPYGAKGLGEIPLLAIGPAVTNAIHHAIGVRLTSAPHTPDQVLEAIRQRNGHSLSAGSVTRNPRRWWSEAVRQLYPLGLQAALRRVSKAWRLHEIAATIETVHQPETKPDILRLLEMYGDAAPLAGGTDILVLETQGLPVPRVLIKLTDCEALAGIRERDDGSLELGATVTLAELAESSIAGPALQATALQIATPQIRQVATVGGNLCQAKRCWFFRSGMDCYKRGGPTRPCYAITGDHRFYHAVQDAHRCQAITPSDLATTLIALDATMIIERSADQRRLPVQRLYCGPGEVILSGSEVITSISIPALARARKTIYRKFSLWEGAFAIATICVSASFSSQGIVQEIRIALGGVSAKPYREIRLEQMLKGRKIDGKTIDHCVVSWLRRTHPLAHNHWKAFATANILRRALSDLHEGQQQ